MLKNNWLKQNKMLVIAAIITLTTGATVYAESNFATVNNNKAETMGHSTSVMDMDEKVAEMNEKWEKLSDEQKAEVYNLEEERSEIEQKIIDKYQEYGLITEKDAAEIKEHDSERAATLRENSEMVMIKMGRGKHMEMKMSPKGDRPDMENKEVGDVS